MMKYIELFKAYQWHLRANKAEEQLKLHRDHELKDIGLHRGDIHRLAHRKCPWCAASNAE